MFGTTDSYFSDWDKISQQQIRISQNTAEQILQGKKSLKTKDLKNLPIFQNYAGNENFEKVISSFGKNVDAKELSFLITYLDASSTDKLNRKANDDGFFLDLGFTKNPENLIDIDPKDAYKKYKISEKNAAQADEMAKLKDASNKYHSKTGDIRVPEEALGIKDMPYKLPEPTAPAANQEALEAAIAKEQEALGAVKRQYLTLMLAGETGKAENLLAQVREIHKDNPEEAQKAIDFITEKPTAPAADQEALEAAIAKEQEALGTVKRQYLTLMLAGETGKAENLLTQIREIYKDNPEEAQKALDFITDK